MDADLKIGIAGLGTVGQGVVSMLLQNQASIRTKSGKNITVTTVSARNRDKDRDLDISRFCWEDNPVKMAQRPDIDVFVELIGGSEGIALESVRAALRNGKDVVTANKAMLAHHGQELAELADEHSSCIRFEAAVAGGIPVVKSLTESLAGNQVNRILGVMNGTCNYILTKMEKEKLPYRTVFEEAQKLGYLEADPSLDVGGIDAGHKLALLSSIAFGTKVDFDNMEIEGIERISFGDIEQAKDMGFRIKLLGISKFTENGLEQRTQPCLVPEKSPLGQIEDATNLVVFEGDFVGTIYLQGPGAGGGPTASSVLSDLIELARGIRIPMFGQRANTLKMAQPCKSAVEVPYYLRLLLKDEPGVLAKIATSLGNAGISINRMRQYGHATEAAPVIIVTHKTNRKNLNLALSEIRSSDVSLEDPFAIRIEEIE